jgi:hypothetical protein
MHNAFMRTSVTLEEDVYQHAMLYARGRGLTLGRAIGELIRPPAKTAASTLRRSPEGFPLFPLRGRVITPEMVKQYGEDEIV